MFRSPVPTQEPQVCYRLVGLGTSPLLWSHWQSVGPSALKITGGSDLRNTLTKYLQRDTTQTRLLKQYCVFSYKIIGSNRVVVS